MCVTQELRSFAQQWSFDQICGDIDFWMLVCTTILAHLPQARNSQNEIIFFINKMDPLKKSKNDGQVV